MILSGGLRRSLTAAALLWSVNSLNAQQQATAYDRGKQALAAHHYAEAAALLASAASAASAPPDTLLLEARALAGAGDLPGAERTLHLYLGPRPSSASALYLLAEVLKREDKPKESLQTLTAAAALRPPGSYDLVVAAIDYVLLDDYRDAIHWLTRAVALDPANAEAWYDLGRSLMHEGRFPEAESAFRRSLVLAPDDSRSLNNLGLCLEAQNRNSDALAFYQRAVAAQAGRPHPSEQPLLNLGALLNTQGSGAQAIAPLQQAVTLAPKESRCHEELARALTQAGQQVAAVAELQEAIVLDGSNPRLHFQLGQLYRRLGRSAEAEAELKRSAALYGNRSSAPEPM